MQLAAPLHHEACPPATSSTREKKRVPRSTTTEPYTVHSAQCKQAAHVPHKRSASTRRHRRSYSTTWQQCIHSCAMRRRHMTAIIPLASAAAMKTGGGSLSLAASKTPPAAICTASTVSVGCCSSSRRSRRPIPLAHVRNTRVSGHCFCSAEILAVPCASVSSSRRRHAVAHTIRTSSEQGGGGES